MKTNKKELLDSFKGGLIVSCQVQHDDPTFSVDFVVKMAKAAQWGGAVGIRANDPEQIKAIKKEVDLPVIGLWKIWHDDTDVFITPTLEAAKAVWEAGAEIIALDCTSQITHEGRPAYELLPIVKKEIQEAIIFADVSNYEEAVRAVEIGADIVGPTLYGYTEATKHIEQPDLREFARMCRDFKDKAYVIMEGHIYSPEDAMKCIFLGAHSVVVGSAITRPHLITKRFTDLLTGYQNNWREAKAKEYLQALLKERDPEYKDLGNTGAKLADEIMTHRRIELWGEGFRWFDLKRLGLPLDRTGSNFDATFCGFLHKDPNADGWIFEIPKKETDFNDLIEKNY